ncbi:hypothetical protein JCM19231_2313 [Vibrio ishigakensis]|uniref:Lipoprotein n=1 Tax=Vibrio ishigakensis TaxID=1481914 RepID=A0A0B8P7K8_9VIBR|nr:hypothetical protein [Vibrio ishigakensis]GAM59218.1 hypothetical protein JCM19231_2313 [Vibrio ishigakensis]
MKKLLALTVLALAGCASGTDSKPEGEGKTDAGSGAFTVTTNTSGFDNEVTTHFTANPDSPIMIEPKSDELAASISLQRISVRDGNVVDVKVMREDVRGMLTMVVTNNDKEYPFSTLGAIENLTGEGEGYSSQLFRMDCKTLLNYAKQKGGQEYELRITATNGFTDYVLTKEAKQMFGAASGACQQ